MEEDRILIEKSKEEGEDLKMEKELKKTKKIAGITLIALVITIVVLIILAGVLINISLGNNGLFNKAKTAKEMYVNSQAQEELDVANMTNSIDSWTRAGNNNSTYKIEKIGETTGLTALSVDFSKYDAIYIVLQPSGFEYMANIIPTFELKTNYDYILGTDFFNGGRWGTVRFSSNSVVIHEVYVNGEHKESEAKLAIYGIKY